MLQGGSRLEHILRNALLALFDQPSATLADILRLLYDSPLMPSFKVGHQDRSSLTQNWPITPSCSSILS